MDLTKLSDADLLALQSGDLSKVSDEGLAHLTGEAPARKPSVLDAPNALTTGLTRGLVRLAGMPTDAVANVIDLGKAALGAPYTAVTGKPAPEMLQLTPREDTVGTGDWLLKQAAKNKAASAMVNPANPDYEGGYTQAVGGALAGATTPAQAAMAATGAIAGKYAGDASGSVPLAIAASLAVPAAARNLPHNVKVAIRGDESGRLRMEQRLKDLRDAGVNNPTLGLASGNNTISGLESVLQKIPGSMGLFARARDEALGGLNTTAQSAAELASTNRGSRAAGQAVQDDLNSFYKRVVSPGYQRLNDNAEGVIGTRTRIPVTNAENTTQRLSTPDPDARATSATMLQPRLAQWNKTLDADQGAIPGYYGPAGMYVPPVPAQGLPYGVVKNLRSSIGEEARSKDVVGTPAQKAIKSMYAALSDDMRNGAVQSDLNSGKILQTRTPGSATGALERANDFYRSGMERIDRTAPFANKVAPEATFKALDSAAKENVSSLQAVKKSITPETRGSVAGTIIERLGRATSGNQNEAGDVFSPQTFLTNWDKLGAKGQQELFSGFKNAPEVRAKVESVAKAASMMRDNAKDWANPSGTAANAHARDLLFGALVGAPAAALGLMSPAIPAMAIGTLGASRVASQLVTNPKVVKWAAEPSQGLSPEEIGALSRFLTTSGVTER